MVVTNDDAAWERHVRDLDEQQEQEHHDELVHNGLQTADEIEDRIKAGGTEVAERDQQLLALARELQRLRELGPSARSARSEVQWLQQRAARDRDVSVRCWGSPAFEGETSMSCDHANKVRRPSLSPHWVCSDCGHTQLEGESNDQARARAALVQRAAAAVDHFDEDELERYAEQQRALLEPEDDSESATHPKPNPQRLRHFRRVSRWGRTNRS